MPELPEVEVVKKSLKENILNLTLKKVKINSLKLRYKVPKKKISEIINKKIIKIYRRSKYIVLNSSNNLSIIVHLGMTGKFYIIKKDLKLKKLSFYYKISNKLSKHDHIIFEFNKKVRLIYNDVRKFGFFLIVNTQDINELRFFKSLGPEPLSIEFNHINFKKKLSKRNLPVKSLLMDQTVISGLGNIYANEILYFCKISPLKKADKLNSDDIKKIIVYTKKILKNAINLGGSSIKDFKKSDGKFGKYQQKFKVYGKDNLKCPTRDCKSFIRKVRLSGRSTYFCPSCQK